MSSLHEKVISLGPILIEAENHSSEEFEDSFSRLIDILENQITRQIEGAKGIDSPSRILHAMSCAADREFERACNEIDRDVFGISAADDN